MKDIDNRVAFEVMGWQSKSTTAYLQDYYMTPEGKLFPREWNPSTRMDHAWKVVEKLRERWSVEVYGSGPWDAAICYCCINNEPRPYGDPDNHVGYAEAETAPLAICKAALAAVEGTK